MALDRDNSVESFEICGFRTDQAEHLSRLSNTMDAIINRRQAGCSDDMSQEYKRQISELKDEIDYYWAKYQEENI